MKSSICFLLLWMSVSLAFTQSPIKHSLFFDSDTYQLNPSHQHQLSSILDTLPLDRIKEVNIYGNTDSISSLTYNLALSQKRAFAAREFLSQRIPNSLIHEFYKGESSPMASNKTSEGRQKNRRVDIILLLKPPIVKEEVVMVPPDTMPKERDCNRDTTIILEQGTEVVVNICDYEEVEGCIKVSEFISGEQIQASSITTTTTQGQPLISGGMFYLDLCKEVEITVRIPIIEGCSETEDMQAWVSDDGKSWEANEDIPLEVVQEDEKRYFEIRVSSPGWFNVDKLPLPNLNFPPPPRIKVKAKKKLELLKVIFSYPCPIFLVPAKISGKKKDKAFSNLICPDPNVQPLVYIEAANQENDTLIIDYEPLHGLEEKSLARGGCRTGRIKNRILGIPIWEKRLYGKYVVKPEHFESESLAHSKKK